MAEEQKQLQKVINALEKVNNEIQQMIMQMANIMNDMEIIQSFNQESLDLFSMITEITKEIGKESEVKFGGYKLLLENAMKLNIRLPVDNFTLVVLEYAPYIYNQDEEFFLRKSYNNAKVEVGNEFAFIKSDSFKEMWKNLSPDSKEDIKKKFLNVTIFAHVYFIKTVFNNLK